MLLQPVAGFGLKILNKCVACIRIGWGAFFPAGNQNSGHIVFGCLASSLKVERSARHT